MTQSERWNQQRRTSRGRGGPFGTSLLPLRPQRFGSGAELLQPLAICVIGGLLFALVLSLVVTPAVYAMMRRRGARHPTRIEPRYDGRR